MSDNVLIFCSNSVNGGTALIMSQLSIMDYLKIIHKLKLKRI